MTEGKESNNRLVRIEWTALDFLLPLEQLTKGKITQEEFENLPQMTVSLISEEAISKFCGACELLGPDNICTQRYGRPNQARFVARQWCGWANVNGKRGEMTDQGFEPHSTS